jgi:hypothetical protein
MSEHMSFLWSILPYTHMYIYLYAYAWCVCVCVDGTWIQDKELGIVWHYENADPVYGRMQAQELCKYLERVLVDPRIHVVKNDAKRILGTCGVEDSLGVL